MNTIIWYEDGRDIEWKKQNNWIKRKNRKHKLKNALKMWSKTEINVIWGKNNDNGLIKNVPESDTKFKSFEKKEGWWKESLNIKIERINPIKIETNERERKRNVTECGLKWNDLSQIPSSWI